LFSSFLLLLQNYFELICDDFTTSQPTVCVTCVWAGVDSAWEQGKLEARKMLENAAESHTSGARFVGLRFYMFSISFP